jgi:pimeloyl-ACP methyl ester carboxylesterase
MTGVEGVAGAAGPHSASLTAALQRQTGAALRTMLRPASYLGLAREALLTSVHLTTYPLGLMPPLPFRHDPIDASIPRRPVVLVHGWVHNRSGFLLMTRALRRAGLGPVHAFDYPSITSDLNQVAHHLAPVVEHVVGHARADSCVLIGHSMGGLVARQYVQELGGHDLVDTVITLGTPHRGTYSAWLGVGRAAEQCRPGSDYLAQLEHTARPDLARWISYYSDLDLMVTPAVSAKLLTPALDATNVRIRDIGHLSLLMSRPVLADLLMRLEEPVATA